MEEIPYEKLAKLVNAIANPLASKKLTKRLLKVSGCGMLVILGLSIILY